MDKQTKDYLRRRGSVPSPAQDLDGWLFMYLLLNGMFDEE